MPIIYTGAPNIIAKLEELYRASVPGDIASSDRRLDEARALAEMMATAEGEAMGFAREARLSTSHGIWTDEHARGRGLARQGDESDASLIERLRTSPRALTEDAIYAAVAAIIATTGATGPAAAFYILRIPIDIGAFADTDCWCDAGSRVTSTRIRVTIALLPAALGVRAAVLDALRSKVATGHLYGVEEF